MSEKTSKPKTITLNTEVIDKVEKMAQQQNRNFSNMVETLLMNNLKEIRL